MPLLPLRRQVWYEVWRRPSSDKTRLYQGVSHACNGPGHRLCEGRLARGLLGGAQHLLTKSQWRVLSKALSVAPLLVESLSWLLQGPVLPWELPVKGSVLAVRPRRWVEDPPRTSRLH